MQPIPVLKHKPKSFSNIFLYTYLVLVFALILPATLQAQSSGGGQNKNTVELIAPESVEINTPFILVVSTTDLPEEMVIQGKDFVNQGQFGFASSKSLINGVFSERRIGQYQLVATALGNLTITVSVGKITNRVSIKVVVSGKSYRTPPPSPSAKKKPFNRPLTDLVKVKNVVKKSSLFINELTELITIIYTAVPIRNPSLAKHFNESCYSLVPVEKFDRENKDVTISGVTYYQTVIMKHLLYPVKRGGCTIENIAFQVAVTPTDNFGFGLNNEIITITTEPITLNVKDYPAKDGRGRSQPTDFNYQYGNFGLNYILSENRFTPNEPLTLTVILSGTGNFYTLGEPIFKNLSPLITVSKQGVSDQYQVIENDIGGKKLYHYYLTYQGGTTAGATGAKQSATPQPDVIPLPQITLSYYSGKEHGYVLETEHLPSLPVVIPGPSTIELADAKILPSWSDPIFNLNDIKRLTESHSETQNLSLSLTSGGDTAWSIVGWYHLAGGLVGIAGMLSMLFFFGGVRIPLNADNSFLSPTDRLNDIWKKFYSPTKPRLLRLKNQSDLSSASDTISERNHVVESASVSWFDGLSDGLTATKKHITLLEQKNLPAPKLSRRCVAIINKLIRVLPQHLPPLTAEISPSLSPTVMINIVKLEKTYWHTLATLLSMVARTYLQTKNHVALSKAIQEVLNNLNTSTPTSTPVTENKQIVINWLTEVQTKLNLYEQHTYQTYTKSDNMWSINTIKNFRSEAESLIKILQNLPPANPLSSDNS